MALTECIECGGKVSDAASSCPHCGHPNPGRSTDSDVSKLSQESDSDVSNSVESEQVAVRPLWPVFLWTVGGFAFGTIVNALIEAAGIVVSGDFFGFPNVYRGSWFWRLLPYGFAVLGAFVGLARKKRDTKNPYKTLALALFAVMAVGVGAVLYNASTLNSREIEPISVAATTTTTATRPTTTTSDPTACHPPRGRLSTFRRWECHGDYRLGDLVLVDYWDTKWIPLLEGVIGAREEGNEAGARIACELAKDERSEYADRILFWEPSPSREIATVWFDEMKVVLAACANGSWDAASESFDLVSAYLREACENIPTCSGISE